MNHARGTLRKIFADAVRREAGDDAAVLAWPLVCGGAVAQKTSALKFTDGVLVVAVPDTAWRKQLQLLNRQYLAGLNQMTARKVESISFVVAPQPRPTA